MKLMETKEQQQKALSEFEKAINDKMMSATRSEFGKYSKSSKNFGMTN